MGTIRLILTILGIFMIIGPADTLTRESKERKSNIAIWSFLIMYALTIGFMWW